MKLSLIKSLLPVAAIIVLAVGCENNPSESKDLELETRTSSATNPGVVTSSGSQSSAASAVYDVLPEVVP